MCTSAHISTLIRPIWTLIAIYLSTEPQQSCWDWKKKSFLSVINKCFDATSTLILWTFMFAYKTSVWVSFIYFFPVFIVKQLNWHRRWCVIQILLASPALFGVRAGLSHLFKFHPVFLTTEPQRTLMSIYQNAVGFSGFWSAKSSVATGEQKRRFFTFNKNFHVFIWLNIPSLSHSLKCLKSGEHVHIRKIKSYFLNKRVAVSYKFNQSPITWTYN